MSTTRAELLADTSWLAEHLNDPDLSLVDIRGSIRPPTAPKPHYSAKRDAYLERSTPVLGSRRMSP